MKIWKVTLIALTASTLAAVTLLSAAQNSDKVLTMEQCRTDAKLYGKDDAVDLPTAKSLQNQADEMQECETKTDSTNWRQYHILVDKFLIAISLRESDFISRHKLQAQFVAEDEAGMR
jgi:hypothetical protein